MIVRDVLLTLAHHEFFNPKWSDRIHDEWTSNLIARRQAAGITEDARAQIEATRRAIFRLKRRYCVRSIQRIDTSRWSP